jgi:hypothetical protein
MIERGGVALGVIARAGKTGEEFLYDTSEKEFRVWSIGFRQEKQHSCPEAKM